MFNIFKLFKRCWIGEASLALVFWIVYFLFNLILISIFYFSIKFFSPLYIYDHGQHKFMDLLMALSLPYLFISSTFVWIAGKNSWRIFNWGSKIIIVLVLIYISFHIIRL